MSAERVCADSGLLVDGETRLLTDPCEYYHPGFGVQVGCGRLRCSNCKAWVRGGPPGLGLAEGVPVDLRALHAAPDWAALPFVESVYALHNRMRLYACTCRYWVAEKIGSIDNDHDSDSDPDVPWACAGHPTPALPLTLNTLEIRSATNWDALVEKVLAGACPRELERREALGAEPALWLVWLYAYLRGLAVDEQLSVAVAKRISDPDPQVVGRVLYFFVEFPRAKGIESLVARAEADVHRVFVGYPIPEHPPVLSLWSVLAARLEHARDERVKSLVTKLLFVPRSSLPHDDLGPKGPIDFERQRRERLGWDADTLDFVVNDFARLRKSEREDVIGYELARSSPILADPQMREFLAENILKLDAASPGRWRAVMTLLSDWLHKPDQGHLLVIAGAHVIEAGLASADELNAWISSRRAYGWVDDAWVQPLQGLLEQRAR